MRHAMWAYPWDVQKLGAAAVARELRERAGMDAISLASAYHAGRFVSPRGRHKVVWPEDGTVYFHTTPGRWTDAAMRPQPARLLAAGDPLAALIALRDAGGLGVSCWTVCLHNTRLGERHPGAVTVGPFGDANPFSLCPAHPDARTYVRTLVADLSHTYRPDRIELETVSFMGFAHDHHHEKDGVGLLPEEDFLLSLCFCDACVARAAAAGVDAAAARRTVVALLAATFERPVPEPRFADYPARGIAAFAAYPEIHEFLTWRSEPVTSLVAEIRAAAHPDTSVCLIDLADGWRGGCDLAAAAAACDGAILCAYGETPDRVAAAARTGRAALGDRFLGIGLRLFHPEVAGPADMAAAVDAARAGGADGVNVYNHGLVPAARLDWAGTALAGWSLP